MTAEERAALVERVARELAAFQGEIQEGVWKFYVPDATAAIDIIRAEVLEEAARAADEQAKVFRDEAHDQKVWGNGAMSKRALSIAHFFLQHAAAVRALKEKV